MEIPTATYTEADMHRVLGHASPEVIKHVSEAAEGIVIDRSIPCPSTIECESCSLSKATEIVPRRTEVEDKANGEPFDGISWDLIPMTPAYNGDE
jgi:hypothetical protein